MPDRSYPLHPANQARGGGGELQPCPRCGGSGQLRTGHGAYRTCLDCAGRGVLSATTAPARHQA